jgi:hypothetical protein
MAVLAATASVSLRITALLFMLMLSAYFILGQDARLFLTVSAPTAPANSRVRLDTFPYIFGPIL